MTFTNMKCPSCDGEIEFKEGSDHALCPYCGRKYYLEKSAQQVEYELCEENAKALKVYIEKTQALNKLENEINSLKEKIDINKTKNLSLFNMIKHKHSQLDKFNDKAKFYLKYILIGYIILAMILNSVESAVFTICVLTLYILFRKIICKKRNEEIEHDIFSLNELEQQTDKLNTDYDSNFLPKKYRTDEAMEYIYDLLLSHRVSNIPQGINMYEDEKHKRRIESIQLQQIEQMKKQNSIADAQMQQQAQQASQSELNKKVAVGGMILTGLAATKKILKEIDKLK